MYAMFVKELQQFCRGIISKIMAALIVLAWVLLIFASRCEVPGIEELQNSDPLYVVIYYRIFIYGMALAAIGMCGVVIALGASAARWRNELGDPAFSPGVTSCTPAWQLALGKWSALLSQVMIFALFACVLPLMIFFDLTAVETLIGFGTQFSSADFRMAAFAAQIGKMAAKVPLLCVCMIINLTSLSLAVCSLKPKSRGKFDFGAMAVVLLLGMQSYAITAGASMEHFNSEVMLRTLVITVGSLALISSGVSAPGANRLFFFKIWCFAAMTLILPFVRKARGVFSAEEWSFELIIAANFFLICSLFERLLQSRRVLAQMRNPLLAVIAFPFSTGALNSFALSGVFLALAWICTPLKMTGEVEGLFIIGVFAALANFAGFCFERLGKSFIRFAAFLIVLCLYGALRAGLEVNLPDFYAEHDNIFRVVKVILTVGALFVLAINYNYRKKDL